MDVVVLTKSMFLHQLCWPPTFLLEILALFVCKLHLIARKAYRAGFLKRVNDRGLCPFRIKEDMDSHLTKLQFLRLSRDLRKSAHDLMQYEPGPLVYCDPSAIESLIGSRR